MAETEPSSSAPGGEPSPSSSTASRGSGEPPASPRLAKSPSSLVGLRRETKGNGEQEPGDEPTTSKTDADQEPVETSSESQSSTEVSVSEKKMSNEEIEHPGSTIKENKNVEGEEDAKLVSIPQEISDGVHDLVLSISESSYGKEKKQDSDAHPLSEFIDDADGHVIMQHTAKDNEGVELDKRALLAQLDASHSNIFEMPIRLEINNSIHGCITKIIVLLQLYGSLFYSLRLNGLIGSTLSLVRSLSALVFDFRAVSAALIWNASNNTDGSEAAGPSILVQAAVIWILSAFSSIYLIIISTVKRSTGKIVGFEASQKSGRVAADKIVLAIQRISFVPAAHIFGKSFNKVYGSVERDKCFINYSPDLECGNNMSMIFSVVCGIVLAIFVVSRLVSIIKASLYHRSVSFIGRFDKAMENAEILLGCGLSLEYRKNSCIIESSNRYSPILGFIIDIILCVIGVLSGLGSNSVGILVALMAFGTILTVISISFPFRTIQLSLTNLALSVAQIPVLSLMIVRNTQPINGYTSVDGAYTITVIFLVLEIIVDFASIILVCIPMTTWPQPNKLYKKFDGNRRRLGDILRSIKKCEYRLLKISIEPLVFTPLQEIKEILAIVEDADNIFEGVRCDVLQRHTKQMLSRVRDVEARKLKENRLRIEDNINTREVYTKLYALIEDIDSKYALLPDITRKMLMNSFVITHILATARKIRGERRNEQRNTTNKSTDNLATVGSAIDTNLIGSFNDSSNNNEISHRDSEGNGFSAITDVDTSMDNEKNEIVSNIEGEGDIMESGLNSEPSFSS